MLGWRKTLSRQRRLNPRFMEGSLMSEGQMVFLFCVIYSGALSVVIWVNLLARERLKAHLSNPEFRAESPDKFKRGA